MVFKRELKWLLRELAEIVGEIEAGIKYFFLYLWHLKMSTMTEQKKYAVQQDDDLCASEPFVKYDVSGNLEEMTKSIPLPVLQSWYDKAMEDYKAGRCITLSQLDDMVNRLYGSVKLPESFDYKTNLEDALRERYL